MKQIVIILFSLAFYTTINAQTYKNLNTEVNNWHNGRIELAEGGVLEGKIAYNFITETVSFISDNNSEGYSAYTAAYFAFTDDNNAVTRQFFSLPLKTKSYTGRDEWLFYELIHQAGDIAILSRHTYELHEGENNPRIATGGIAVGASYVKSKEKVKEIIYLLGPGDDIREYAFRVKDKDVSITPSAEWHRGSGSEDYTTYEKSKTERNSSDVYKMYRPVQIWRVIPDEHDRLKEYIKSENLNLKTIEGLVNLLEYYQVLSKAQ